jgi:hypothetical protein
MQLFFLSYSYIWLKFCSFYFRVSDRNCKKAYKIPAWAITSTVLDSKRSFCFWLDGPGLSNVGPNTIAKLCNDILFSASCWWTLWLGRKKNLYKDGNLDKRRWSLIYPVFFFHEIKNKKMSAITTRTSMISTRTSVISTRTSVISTRTSVISTRTRVISTRKVQFPPAACDFTRRVWFQLTRE